MDICRWIEDADGFWITGCGEWIKFDRSGPVGNGLKFCPNCEKPLVEVKHDGE